MGRGSGQNATTNNRIGLRQKEPEFSYLDKDLAKQRTREFIDKWIKGINESEKEHLSSDSADLGIEYYIELQNPEVNIFDKFKVDLINKNSEIFAKGDYEGPPEALSEDLIEIAYKSCFAPEALHSRDSKWKAAVKELEDQGVIKYAADEALWLADVYVRTTKNNSLFSNPNENSKSAQTETKISENQQKLFFENLKEDIGPRIEDENKLNLVINKALNEAFENHKVILDPQR